MKLNGYILAGILAVVAGWLATPFSGALDSPDGVMNFVLPRLAQHAANFGYVLLIVGTLVAGFRWLKTESDT